MTTIAVLLGAHSGASRAIPLGNSTVGVPGSLPSCDVDSYTGPSMPSQVLLCSRVSETEPVRVLVPRVESQPLQPSIG